MSYEIHSDLVAGLCRFGAQFNGNPAEEGSFSSAAKSAFRHGLPAVVDAGRRWRIARFCMAPALAKSDASSAAASRHLMAFDARTGKNLWRFNTGNRLVGSPITYVVDGRQYVAAPSGAVMIALALAE